jgi:MFS family permease
MSASARPVSSAPRRTGGVLRHPAFVKLWAAQVVSAAGSQVTLLALPLTAVLWLNAGAGEMGLLRAAQTSPFLLFGLVAGVWVDRLRRRPVLIAADLGRMLLLATIPFAAAVGLLGMAQLYVVGFLVGVLGLFFAVAHASLLPAIVGPQRLVAANSTVFASDQVVAVAGPSMAGWLIRLVGAPAAIVFDAISFGLSALLLAWNRVTEVPVPPAAERRGIWMELREGLRFVWSTPIVRAVALAMGAYNLFGGIGAALFLLYATRVLGVSPATLGVVLALGAVGGVVGAMAATRLARRLGVGPALIASLALVGIGTVLAPLAALLPGAASLLLAVGQTLFGFASVIFSINAVSLMQACTPERLLGRMTASTRVVIAGTLPLGALVGGGIAHAFGITAALWVAAGGALVAMPLLWRSPVRALTESPSADEVPLRPS